MHLNRRQALETITESPSYYKRPTTEQLLRFVEVTRHTLPYTFSSSEFTYSLRCALCSAECEHSLEQHNILVGRL
jgi:hypothetical protein